MKKLVISIALASAALTSKAQHDCTLVFEDIPYSEGTLYVSVTSGKRDILKEAIAVDESDITVNIDLSDYIGKKLSVKAFQDLNGNGRLDFSDIGYPAEPVLRTEFTPKEGITNHSFKLTEY